MQESISFGKDLRKAIRKTVKVLAKAVKSTLGPSGTNVGVLSQIMLPVIVNDGVTVSDGVKFKDPLKKYILNILKTVSKNTDLIAGDGTSTATTLLEAILVEGIKNIEAGCSPIDIVEGVRIATKEVLEELEKKTTQVRGKKNLLLEIASISANNDKDLGSLISKAFTKVGADGQIDVRDSFTGETYIDFIDGMKYDAGFESNMFSNTDKGTVELNNCSILIYEGKLTTIETILEPLKNIRNENSSILIIADDFSEQAMNDLTHNKVNIKLKVCAVRSPGYGMVKEKSLEDIADATGTSIVSKRFGRTIEEFDEEFLGKASLVKIDANSFNIMGATNSKVITSKIKRLKKEVKLLPHNNLRKEINDRIAKLSNSVAIMYVHGDSPMEASERKYRIEDAINSTRAALEEGIVPGGGITLLKLGDSLRRPKMANRDQEIGFDLLVKALESPIRTICDNSGVSADVVVNKVLEESKFNYGYNAKTKEFGDLIQLGVIDPKKVTKTAFTNASSVAQMMLTMNCAIYE